MVTGASSRVFPSSSPDSTTVWRQFQLLWVNLMVSRMTDTPAPSGTWTVMFTSPVGWPERMSWYPPFDPSFTSRDSLLTFTPNAGRGAAAPPPPPPPPPPPRRLRRRLPRRRFRYRFRFRYHFLSRFRSRFRWPSGPSR